MEPARPHECCVKRAANRQCQPGQGAAQATIATLHCYVAIANRPAVRKGYDVPKKVKDMRALNVAGIKVIFRRAFGWRPTGSSAPMRLPLGRRAHRRDLRQGDVVAKLGQRGGISPMISNPGFAGARAEAGLHQGHFQKGVWVAADPVARGPVRVRVGPARSPAAPLGGGGLTWSAPGGWTCGRGTGVRNVVNAARFSNDFESWPGRSARASWGIKVIFRRAFGLRPTR